MAFLQRRRPLPNTKAIAAAALQHNIKNSSNSSSKRSSSRHRCCSGRLLQLLLCRPSRNTSSSTTPAAAAAVRMASQQTATCSIRPNYFENRTRTVRALSQLNSILRTGSNRDTASMMSSIEHLIPDIDRQYQVQNNCKVLVPLILLLTTWVLKYSQSESQNIRRRKEKTCRVIKDQHSDHRENIQRSGTKNGAIPREGACSRPAKREGQGKAANE